MSMEGHIRIEYICFQNRNLVPCIATAKSLNRPNRILVLCQLSVCRTQKKDLCLHTSYRNSMQYLEKFFGVRLLKMVAMDRESFVFTFKVNFI